MACLEGDIGTSTKKKPRTTKDAEQAAVAAGNRLHLKVPLSALTNKYEREIGHKKLIFKIVLKKTGRNGNQGTRKRFWICRRNLHV